MITDRPAVDWLTLTTFYGTEATRMFNALARRCKGEGKQARIMQYEGRQWPGGFWGNAMQKQRAHYMMRASGETADYVLDELRETCPGRCTRIDLQITIPMPPGYKARHVVDAMHAATWAGRKRAITMIEGSDGLDTVYFGNRQSERYTRLYVKQADDGRYLRFEVEYKGETAQQVYDRSCVQGQQAMGDLLLWEVMTFPEVNLAGIADIRRALVSYVANPTGKGSRVPDPNRTMAWVIRQVSPVVFRLLRDHDQGDVMGRIVQEWYDLAQDLNRVDGQVFDKTWTS